jgi:hypothetical protein
VQKYLSVVNQLIIPKLNNANTTRDQEVRSLLFVKKNFSQVQVDARGECLIISLYFAQIFCKDPRTLTRQMLDEIRNNPLSDKFSDLRKVLSDDLVKFFGDMKLEKPLDLQMFWLLREMFEPGTIPPDVKEEDVFTDGARRDFCIQRIRTSTMSSVAVGDKKERYGFVLSLLLAQRYGRLGDFYLVQQERGYPYGLNLGFHQAPARSDLLPFVFVLDVALDDKSSHYNFALPVGVPDGCDFFGLVKDLPTKQKEKVLDHSWKSFRSLKSVKVHSTTCSCVHLV